MATATSGVSAARLPLVTLVALCTMAPLGGFAASGIAPVMPLISAEFAGTAHADVLVRMMMSGLSATTILGALAAGIMASRVGTPRLLVLLLALYAISGAGIFLLDNLHVMVAARLLQGIANGGAGVLALTLLTTRIPAVRRDRWLGFFTVSGTFGILVLIMVTGALARFGWRYAFLLFLLAVPVALLIGLTLREGRSEPAANSPAPGVSPRRAGIPWGMMFFGALCGGLATSISMYLPYHLAAVGHGSPETVAMLMVVGAGIAGLPALAFGWIRARLSALQTFVVAFGLIAMGLVVLVMAEELPVMFLGMSIHGFGLGAVMPNLISACAAATPAELRARMLGFVRAGIYAGPLLAQPGLEAVTGRSGATAAMLAIAGASALAAVFSIIFRKVFDPVE